MKRVKCIVKFPRPTATTHVKWIPTQPTVLQTLTSRGGCVRTKPPEVNQWKVTRDLQVIIQWHRQVQLSFSKYIVAQPESSSFSFVKYETSNNLLILAISPRTFPKSGYYRSINWLIHEHAQSPLSWQPLIQVQPMKSKQWTVHYFNCTPALTTDSLTVVNFY